MHDNIRRGVQGQKEGRFVGFGMERESRTMHDNIRRGVQGQKEGRFIGFG